MTNLPLTDVVQLIDQINLLPQLCGRVLIAESVLEELSAIETPQVVREWTTSLPGWIEASRPIFKSKCMPCHFSGGKVYDRLPFDQPETIRKLGAKLFTRIKEEHDRRLIEDFLSQTR